MLQKIFAAVRGKAHEQGEAFIDKNAIPIMEQELRDAQKHLDNANTELTGIMARESLAKKEVDQIQDKIQGYERSATAALDKGNEPLALECAEEIARLQDELAAAESNHAQYSQTASTLKASINKWQRSIKQIDQQKSQVKATAAAQKAQAAVAAKHSGQNSAMSSAMASLERIKERQALASEQMNAAESLEQERSGAGLEERLKAAGIGSEANSANDVLARLKAKRTEG